MEDSAKKQLDEEKMVNDAFQHLINTYLASRHRKKVEIITKAFNFAKQAHKGVRRLSGEPYIMHPLAVAQIVCSEIGFHLHLCRLAPRRGRRHRLHRGRRLQHFRS